MEPTTKTYYIVEIGGADLYFERLEEAADFFAKVAKAPIKNIGHTYENGKSLYYTDTSGSIKISMKQETLTVYPSRKAANFASKDGDAE